MDHTLTHTVTGMTEPTDADDVVAIVTRRVLAEQLATVEAKAAEAIARRYRRKVSMAQLSRDSGLSILAIRMICRPEVREAHNNRRRKPAAT